MPKGQKEKEYGEHKYDVGVGTSDCAYNCGCWMGSTRSGGPVGLDPFGVCPNNPVDGVRGNSHDDYNNVVTGRIAKLETELSKAQTQLKAVAPGELKLAEELAAVKMKLINLQSKLTRWRDFLGDVDLE
ncbi:MAG: hypothetical protein AAB766_01620 [Patescibacteria group bacterium]